MALFAAYANVAENPSVEAPGNSTETSDTWLTNSSFKIDVIPFQSKEVEDILHPSHFKTNHANAESHLEEPHSKLKRKHKKKKAKKSHKRQKKRRKDESTSESDPEIGIGKDEEYSIDKTRVTEFKYANSISRPMAPKYRVYKYIGLYKPSKNKKFKRYYQIIFDKHVNGSASEEEKITKKSLDAPKDEKTSKKGSLNLENDVVMIEEQEISRQTAIFNRELQVDLSQIDLWVKYIEFQDAIFNFEKSFRKGSIAKGQRVTAERKLAILDKALQHNPDCERLLRMRLNIAVNVFPADELQTQLGKLVERDSVNIILWQGYIEATQCSMSHCTAPSVINLYVKCLHTLHTIRRTAKINRILLEESILRMLYQCGLFLKQAGLFEQLWTLLRMYLELNLTSEPSSGHTREGDSRCRSTFASTITPDEKQLVDLEDTVLKSQLPIHELWLRIEKLREASHWLPIEGHSEDPQRSVFTEDVSELIHPITVPGNTFRLTVTILTLLKIPLLPSRHSGMKHFGIDYVPWALDSIEILLPMFLPLYPIDVTNNFLSTFTQKLAVGPQYLKTLPGQEEYLQFILTVMEGCINCLEGRNKMAITVWWFRFLRLLAVLEKRELFKVTSGFKKKLRSDMKKVLKENSSNIELFKEYALVQYEESYEGGMGILRIAIRMSGGDVFGKTKEEQAAVVSTLRNLVELHLFRHNFGGIDNEIRQTCLKYIASVVLGAFTIETAPRFVTQTIINQVKAKFAEVNEGILKNPVEIDAVGHFLSDFSTDWLILNAYLLLLTNLGEARIFIENILSNWNNSNVENEDDNDDKMAALTHRKEILYEYLVAILFKTCQDVSGAGMFPTLDKYLQLGITNFPNNMFLLATLAKVQSFHPNFGQPWWRMQEVLLKTGHALPTLFAVLIANQRIAEIENNWVDTITGRVITPDGSFRNRMLNLFKRITKSDMCTRRCGLVWRLYLQFLHAYFEPKVCRAAYYLAVEELPWLKSLYIDAAIYIPEDLAQIQDLIIEKQLRIHVTPEELDVLRN